MGYYTRYELDDKSLNLEDIEDVFNRSVDYNFESIFIDGSPVKWYSHEYDMKHISTFFKDHTFQLKGFGEDDEDIWIEYFLNGKSVHYKAEIKYPELNKLQLK